MSEQAVADVVDSKWKIPDKLLWLFRPFRWVFIILYGGRGSAKTESVARKLILLSMSERTRILCTREVQNSIADSVKQVLEDIIELYELKEYFYITKDKIVCRTTGTDFIFKGMKAGTDPKSQSIKSLKGVKYVWVEEAQTISRKSLDTLTPTIREEGRIFFFTMNRQTSNDAVFARFKGDNDAKFFKINYYDNELCPDVLLVEAKKCKETDSDAYDHVWLGEPANDVQRGVIKRKWVLAAMELYKTAPNDDGVWFGGLDPGDGGADPSAFTLRKGLCFKDCWLWPKVESDDAAQNAITECRELLQPIQKLKRLNFEVTGIGAGARAKFKQNPDIPRYAFNPGGAVQQKNEEVIPGRKNVDHFSNLKAQQWWKLRDFLHNAYKKQHSKPFTGDYMTINPDMEFIDQVIDELCQIEYHDDNKGKIVIDKKPEGTASPNLGDSFMICSHVPEVMFIGASTA